MFFCPSLVTSSFPLICFCSRHQLVFWEQKDKCIATREEKNHCNLVNLANSTSECLLLNIAGILRKKETKNNLQSDAELHLSTGSYYIKLHLNQKCFLGGAEKLEEISQQPNLILLLLLMSIENASVIDGAGNGFSFVCLWR